MNGESKIPPGISVKFFARQFFPQEELDLALAAVPPKYRDEERSNLIAKIVDTFVYKAVQKHGLNDMTITVKRQEANRANFQLEGWSFELRGDKPA